MRTSNPLQRTPTLCWAWPIPPQKTGEAKHGNIQTVFDKLNAAMAKVNTKLPQVAIVGLYVVRPEGQAPHLVAALAASSSLAGPLFGADPGFRRIADLEATAPPPASEPTEPPHADTNPPIAAEEKEKVQ